MTAARLIFAALPSWSRWVLAGAVLVLAASALHWWAVRDAVRDDRAQSAARATETARAADAAASGKIEESRNGIEAENHAARAAAAAGPDPLGDGLRSLRAGQAGAGPAPR